MVKTLTKKGCAEMQIFIIGGIVGYVIGVITVGIAQKWQWPE